MFKKFLIFALGVGAGVAIVKRDTVCERTSLMTAVVHRSVNVRVKPKTLLMK